MREVIRTNGLRIGYKGMPLFPEINVSMMQGDLVALAGPNGAGKTTLFRTLSAGLKPVSGEILVFGKAL